MHDSHGSQVLLPFVKSTERKRKGKAADDSRASMLSKSVDHSMSKSLDQSTINPMAQSGETGEAGTGARPPSATAQALLDRERAHNSRPHSAKTINEDALAVKQKHAVDKELARKEGSSRPVSREGLPRSASREGLPPRPQSRSSDGVAPAQEASSRPASQAAAAAPPSRGAPGTGRGSSGGAAVIKKSQTTPSSPGGKTLPRQQPKGRGRGETGTEARGGRSKKGGDVPTAAGAGGGGGVDNAVVEAMQAELDAYKAAEVRLKERLKDKDSQIHELTHKTFYLNDELNGAHDRQGKMMADVERARESNSRFDDVKQLLQLSENERVKLMDQVLLALLKS